MEHLQLAQIIASRAALAYAGSALPNAPVIPHVERPVRARRTRTTLASLLRRAATLVAPPAQFS